MRQIRMIGLDLDGTLLNTNKELTDYTREVLKKAIAKGVTVLVATGRLSSAIPRELLEFPGMRYAVTANGGRIMDLQEDKLLYHCPVPYEKAVEVLRIAADYDVAREIYFDGFGFMQQDEMEQISHYVFSPPMANYIRTTRTPIPSTRAKMEEMHGHPLDKVHLIFADTDEQAKARSRILALGDLVISSSFGNNLEINAPGVDKGEGLLRLGRILGIPRESIMACGDSDNDLSMLRAAGFSVAMANATQTIKDAADYITCTNDENGVAKAIEKFVLNDEIEE